MFVPGAAGGCDVQRIAQFDYVLVRCLIDVHVDVGSVYAEDQPF